MHCAVCTTHVTLATSLPYVVGAARGRLCKTCQDGLSAAVGRWLSKRTAEVQRELVAAEEDAAAEKSVRERLEAEPKPRGLRVLAGGGGR